MYLIAAQHLLPPQSVVADQRLARLGKERLAFDDHVVRRKGHELEENIYSMGPGEQHIYGFYPFGRSDRRYLLFTSSGEASELLFQGIRKGKPRTLWVLQLRPTRKTGKAHGTLASMLRQWKVEVATKITQVERNALASPEPLAAYGFNGISILHAWTIGADGRKTPAHAYPDIDRVTFYPIVESESEVLGFGRRYWPANLKFEIDPNW